MTVIGRPGIHKALNLVRGIPAALCDRSSQVQVHACAQYVSQQVKVDLRRCEIASKDRTSGYSVIGGWSLLADRLDIGDIRPSAYGAERDIPQMIDDDVTAADGSICALRESCFFAGYQRRGDSRHGAEEIHAVVDHRIGELF
jgi:hypothetical protein